MRVSKFIAQAGITSRRKAEKLILQGKVKVNGKPVKDLTLKIDPKKDKVEYNGRMIKMEEKFTYIMLYKPRGYLTASSDKYKRPLVKKLVKNLGIRLFPVGRLDLDSEGLLLMTNDGELTYRLTHPKFEIEKEYLVETYTPMKENINTILIGIPADEGILKAEYFEQISPTRIKIVLKEGRKREIRRMLGYLGYKVKRLKRIREGPLRIGNLKPGQYRFLTKQEIERLKKVVARDE